MDDCLFCKIASGEISAKIVYEDESVIAFDDIQPQAPVHTLVIPRIHYSNLSADVPSDVICALFSAVPAVADVKGIGESGYRVIVNSGPDAMQTVNHLHVHVIGGFPMGHRMIQSAGE
ncbi:MAG: histidine triad nucleotide-binding protein [Coriobacteriia bacterium]|nr:histidine triad nucleotide-binding protein [Coriobacteriia bacterium]